MACRHENADHLMPGDYYSNGKPFQTIVVACEQLRCSDCGAWLSLGASNDAPPEVQVEMRAVELASVVMDYRRANRRAFLSDIGFDGAEIAGWIERQYDSEKAPEQPGEHAGYLARCIATHEETP